jgi:hypothetical protein
MKKTGIMLLVIVLAAGAGIAENQITVKTLPPSVVKTIPQAGDIAVDPCLTEIKVTFSKDMMTRQMWSWCTHTPNTFPEIDKNKNQYLADKRTCVLPVKLQPGKTYAIWINTQKFNYFKDTNGISAIPYLLVFQTAKQTATTNATNETSAVAVAKKWLALVDNGKYVESWNEAAAYFKGAVSKAQWEQAITATRKPLGKNLSRTLISKQSHSSLPGAPDGKYVVIQFKSAFEAKASAIETITPMLDKDGKWRISGYYIK